MMWVHAERERGEERENGSEESERISYKSNAYIYTSRRQLMSNKVAEIACVVIIQN